MGQIAIIAVCAGILVRTKVVKNEQINALSSITIKILLPCLIFASVVTKFDPEVITFWWLIPIAAIAMCTIGLGISILLFLRNLKEKRNLLPLTCMQNAGYLTLAVGQSLYKEEFGTFATYCFLFILGYSPILWSVGKYLATSDEKIKFSLSTFLTPPFCANIIAVTLVLTGKHELVPAVMIDTIKFLGDTTVPLALFLLGASLGSVSLKSLPGISDIFKVLGVKFAVIPLITVSILYTIGLKDKYPVLSDLFVIQASSAPATALIIQVRSYGGDHEKIGSLMFISYVFCTFAIPVWVVIWRVL